MEMAYLIRFSYPLVIISDSSISELTLLPYCKKAIALITQLDGYIQYQQTKPLIDAPFIFVYMYP
jgi:hypothetical protein